MRPRRVRLRTLMVAVAVVALDCLVIPVAESFAGGLFLGVALQVGAFSLIYSHGRIRRFWVGFEASGIAAMIAYAACRAAHPRAINQWAWQVVNALNGAAGHLPLEASQWYLQHLLINPNKALRVVDLIEVFEVACGVPMLLFATAIGLLVALAGRRGATAQAPPVRPWTPRPPCGSPSRPTRWRRSEERESRP